MRSMNKENNKVGLEIKRIALSDKAIQFLEIEVTRIKEKGTQYKINESKLASAIIELFALKYYKRDSEEIESKFFNKKIYLRKLIEKSSSEEDLENSLNEFLNKARPKKSKELSSHEKE